jgi:hypothetical protein
MINKASRMHGLYILYYYSCDCFHLFILFVFNRINRLSEPFSSYSIPNKSKNYVHSRAVRFCNRVHVLLISINFFCTINRCYVCDQIALNDTSTDVNRSWGTFHDRSSNTGFNGIIFANWNRTLIRFRTANGDRENITTSIVRNSAIRTAAVVILYTVW